MIIDATNLISGRLGTIVAKKAILGEGISILNSDKAVFTGKKQMVLANIKKRSDRGIHTKGPFIPKQPDKFLKRTIRGMLPYKQDKGRKAFARIKCYNGVPAQFNDQKIETIESINVSKMSNTKYVTIKEICKTLGGKYE